MQWMLICLFSFKYICHIWLKHKVTTKSNKYSLFSTLSGPSVNIKYLQALTLAGLTQNNPVVDPLAVLHLDNWLYIFFFHVLDSNNSTSMFVQSESQSTFTPITHWNVGVGVKRRCEPPNFGDANQTSANYSTRFNIQKKNWLIVLFVWSLKMRILDYYLSGFKTNTVKMDN